MTKCVKVPYVCRLSDFQTLQAATTYTYQAETSIKVPVSRQRPILCQSECLLVCTLPKPQMVFLSAAF